MLRLTLLLLLCAILAQHCIIAPNPGPCPKLPKPGPKITFKGKMYQRSIYLDSLKKKAARSLNFCEDVVWPNKNINADIITLGTDNKNYMVTYSCNYIPLTNSHYELAFSYTKDKSPKKDILNAIDTAFKDNKVGDRLSEMNLCNGK